MNYFTILLLLFTTLCVSSRRSRRETLECTLCPGRVSVLGEAIRGSSTVLKGLIDLSCPRFTHQELFCYEISASIDDAIHSATNELLPLNLPANLNKTTLFCQNLARSCPELSTHGNIILRGASCNNCEQALRLVTKALPKVIAVTNSFLAYIMCSKSISDAHQKNCKNLFKDAVTVTSTVSRYLISEEKSIKKVCRQNLHCVE